MSRINRCIVVLVLMGLVQGCASLVLGKDMSIKFEPRKFYWSVDSVAQSRLIADSGSDVCFIQMRRSTAAARGSVYQRIDCWVLRVIAHELGTTFSGLAGKRFNAPNAPAVDSLELTAIEYLLKPNGLQYLSPTPDMYLEIIGEALANDKQPELRSMISSDKRQITEWLFEDGGLTSQAYDALQLHVYRYGEGFVRLEKMDQDLVDLDTFSPCECQKQGFYWLVRSGGKSLVRLTDGKPGAAILNFLNESSL